MKKTFRAATTSSAQPDLPFVPEEHQPWLKEIIRGAEMADENEAENNPRAASVRLRAVQKIREARS